MNFFHAPGVLTRIQSVTTGTSSSGIIVRPDQTNPGTGFVSTRYNQPVWTGVAFRTLAYNNPTGTTPYMMASSPTGATWTYSSVPAGYTMLFAGQDAAGTNMMLLTAMGASIVSQVSYDEGVTWSATGPTGLTLINNTAYMGYVDINNTWYVYSNAVPAVVKLSSDNFATMSTTTTNRSVAGAPFPVFNSAGVGICAPTATGLYERTTDFINWTTSTALSVLPTGTRTVQAAGSGFFAWASKTTTGGCYFSTDGITWTVTNLVTQLSSGTNQYYIPAEFAFVNGVYICVFNNYDFSIGGQLLSGRYYRSTDGITWTLSNALSAMYNWTSKCESPTRAFIGTGGMGWGIPNYAIIT